MDVRCDLDWKVWIWTSETSFGPNDSAQPVSDVMFLLPFSAKSRRKPPIRVSTDVCFISRNTIFISPEVFLISIKAIFISPEVFYLLRRHFHLPIGVFTILPLNPPHDRKWEWREEISMDWLNDNRNRKSVLDPDNTQSDFDDSQRASDFCEMQIFFA